MRKLNASDLLKCTAILGRVGKRLEIDETMNDKQIGISFLASAMEHAETDLKGLLAGIAEISIEDFEKQPFDYPIEVVEFLADNEDLAGFLQRVKSLTIKLSKKSSTK